MPDGLQGKQAPRDRAARGRPGEKGAAGRSACITGSSADKVKLTPCKRL